MRRGISRGRGRPMQQRQNQFANDEVDESLMTGHFPGLKDIDMELELLKRKREIIEQQQLILANDFTQRNNYDQLMFNQSLGDFNNYSNTFESAANRKRPISVWEDEVASKRFSGPSKGIKKFFGSRLGPKADNPNSQSGPPAQKPYKPWLNTPSFNAPPRPSAPQKKAFNLNKVTKPSQANVAQPLMKLNTYRPADRKKLVSETVSLTTRSRPKTSRYDHGPVLRSDCEPSPQVNGRLELALGNIVKEIKLRNPDYSDLFVAHGSLRAIKQVVRDRVKAVMLGKVVGTCDSIKEHYHNSYPKETDDEVILKALEVHEGGISLIQSDDPEVYFKKNISKLLILKVDDMLKKVESFVRNENNSKPSGKTLKDEEKKPTIDSQNIDANDKIQVEGDEIDGEKAAIDTEPPKDDNVEAAQSPIKESQPVSKEPTRGRGKFKIIGDEIRKEQQKIEHSMISNKTYVAFDRLLTSKVPHLLRKFIPSILKLLDADKMYNKLKKEIVEETKRKLNKDKATAQDTPVVNKPYQPLKYFVKVLGKPGLPKRKVMQGFFKEYEPKSIKKHRTAHNLLFVGFSEKEPFERILAANGTSLGRYILEIKVSERSNDKKNANLNNSNELGPELDNQIDELLTSIRQAEELETSDVVMLENEDEVTIVCDADENNIESSPTDETLPGNEYYDPKAAGDEDVELSTAGGNENNDTKAQENKVTNENEGTKFAASSEIAVKEYPEPETGNETSEIAVKEYPEPETGNQESEVASNKESKEEEIVNVLENKDDEMKNSDNAVGIEESDKVDVVEPPKAEGKGTPARASARLANTPSSIRTRRYSKLN